VVLVMLGAGLAAVGWGRVRASTPGEYVDPSLRPDEPGYVAVVTPTPTLLVVHKGSDDVLSGVTLLALRSGNEGGSVIVMPAATRARAGDDDVTLAAAYAEEGAQAVARAAGDVLNLDVGVPVELDDAELASLLEPVGPLSLELEHDVGYWEAGEVEIDPDQAGAFLSARRDDESELGRLPRQESFWQAWLDQLAGADAASIPGEDDAGLGRFLHGLTSGPLSVTSLPVAPVSGSSAAEEELAADVDMVAAVVADQVPYPQEPAPGRRVRVRLLNGTEDTDLVVQVVPLLVGAGAEIGLSGNAESFEEPQTRLLYSTARQRDEAETLRDALGFGVVEPSAVDETVPPGAESERVDVTVILGADASAAMRRSESPD
jgi:LytR cell envelope-related transcriptional attenuator